MAFKNIIKMSFVFKANAAAYLTNNGGYEMFDIYLYDAAFGGKHLYEEDFTIEFLEGAIDGVGNPIVPCKYQYTAEDQSFSVYVPKTNVTNVSAAPQDAYNLSEIWIRLDSAYDTYYNAINLGNSGASQELYDTATKYIRINGKSVENADSTVYVHLANYGAVEMFDIMYYNYADGTRLIDKDFTLEIVAGATDSHGNPILPVKYQWSASSGAFCDFDASTLALMRRQILEGYENLTFDFNTDGVFDIRDFINFKKQLAS